MQSSKKLTENQKTSATVQKEQVVIRFSGDSGDGMQLTGLQFTDAAALHGNDLQTFPDFPSEIRAPSGTVAGVSSYQIQFGSLEIFTPGDECDVLVAMNAAALKADKKRLKTGGIIILNTAGFDNKHLTLAGYEEGDSPLENGSLDDYTVYSLDVDYLTRQAAGSSTINARDTQRYRNMFVLGLVFWLFDRDCRFAEASIKDKFKKKPEMVEANIRALHAGWNFGENMDLFHARYTIPQAKLKPGRYRNIHGNHAIGIALLAAAEKSGLPLFLGSYPITPATEILQGLSRFRNNGVKTFQAEDEIAAICACIGAAYAGQLAVTTTSGPGMSLKAEALGLATMLELPLVIVNVQRGGPSTGLPTKTEQSDLLMSLHGRHGEAPLAVLAASSPADCFDVTFEACRLAIEHMTPVILLSDGYIAKGSEPWRFPNAEDLPAINVNFLQKPNGEEGDVLPYKRNEIGVRPWILPGTPGLEHRIGGLEKQVNTGHVSYEPMNHDIMVKSRAVKIEAIAQRIPPVVIDNGDPKASLVVLTWGSTYGSVKSAVRLLLQDHIKVAHIHLRYLNPLPANLEALLEGFQFVLVPEMNMGQLAGIIQSKYARKVLSLTKVQGQPFLVKEIMNHIRLLLNPE